MDVDPGIAKAIISGATTIIAGLCGAVAGKQQERKKTQAVEEVRADAAKIDASATLIDVMARRLSVIEDRLPTLEQQLRDSQDDRDHLLKRISYLEEEGEVNRAELSRLQDQLIIKDGEIAELRKLVEEKKEKKAEGNP